jgi:hypothetical protein
MKGKDNNSFYYNGIIQLDKNISRLVRLSGDTSEPRRAFVQSLVSNALGELKRSVAATERTRESILTRVSLLDRVMGIAAMTTVVCGAGLSILLSVLVKLNAFVAVAVLVVMFINWLAYLGGLVL